MQGMSEFIKQHNLYLKTAYWDDKFPDYHLEQIRFLQHERLVHLIVMLFVISAALLFLVMFLILDRILFLTLFGMLLVLSIFYILHYFKLENTVMKWYFIYNDHVKSLNRDHDPAGS